MPPTFINSRFFFLNSQPTTTLFDDNLLAGLVIMNGTQVHAKILMVVKNIYELQLRKNTVFANIDEMTYIKFKIIEDSGRKWR